MLADFTFYTFQINEEILLFDFYEKDNTKMISNSCGYYCIGYGKKYIYLFDEGIYFEKKCIPYNYHHSEKLCSHFERCRDTSIKCYKITEKPSIFHVVPCTNGTNGCYLGHHPTFENSESNPNSHLTPFKLNGFKEENFGKNLYC